MSFERKQQISLDEFLIAEDQIEVKLYRKGYFYQIMDKHEQLPLRDLICNQITRIKPLL